MRQKARKLFFKLSGGGGGIVFFFFGQGVITIMLTQISKPNRTIESS